MAMIGHAKYLDKVNLMINYQKFEKDGPTTGPVVLRQGEPGTSQYLGCDAKRCH